MTDKQAQEDQMMDKFLDPKYKIKPSVLKHIVSLNKGRNFSEEVDELEKLAKSNNSPPDNLNYWLINGLKTDLKNGLDETDLQERENSYGHNRSVIVATKGFFTLFMEALDDFTLKILIFCAILSIIIQMATAEDSDERSIAWVEGFAILVAVFVCSVVAAGNDYQKEKQFQALNKVSDEMKKVSVFRKGQRINLHKDFLLVGDIVNITSGMEIPTDGIVLSGQDITTDESVMTGEPDPVHKSDLAKCIQEREKVRQENPNGVGAMNRHDVPSPILMSGTSVLSGEGLYIVTVLGKYSCQGEIEEKLKQKEEGPTPLQEKLTVIAEDIGKFGGYSALVIIIVMLIRFTIERIHENEFEGKHLSEILDFFIIGVTVVVVAIPEGLPLSVTLSLAFSTKKMLADKNLVRKLQACETMGGANNICSDKTGTLTMNKMDLTKLWNKTEISINPNAESLNLDDYVPKNSQDIFLQIIAVNNAAEITKKVDKDGKEQIIELGSATELAFLKFLQKCKFDWNDYSSKFEIQHKIPFSSSRKMMSTVIIVNGKRRLLVKGASEIVLSGCQKQYNWDTCQEEDINNQTKQNIEQAIENFANQAMRTICLAYKNLGSNIQDVEAQDKKGVRDVEKQDLVFVGLCGINDNLREGVPEAVKQCQKSGITVRMVTGDNQVTARAIAMKCNIYQEKENHQVILGEDFMNKVGPVVCKKCQTEQCPCPLYIDQEEIEKQKKLEQEEKKAAKQKGEKYIEKDVEKGKKREVRVDCLKNQAVFKQIYPKLTVMARSRPEDKYAFVLGLKDENEVVAVTGDGTNDSTALKKADVGFAMGIAGTQVAKDASDIILTDDNFSSIVKAVLWGRNIYDSIRKFLQFQLTVNVVAVVVTLVGAAISKQDFLKPIQMLWVNLIMDTFASLALATEPPLQKLLDRQPHSRNDYIVSCKMAKHIIFQSIYQLIVILVISFSGETFIPEYIDDFDKDKDFLLKYKYNLSKINLEEYNKGNEASLYVTSGRHKSYDGFDEEYSEEAQDLTPSRHFTFLFNAFVMLQFFNFLNARKIEDEWNIFSGIFNNWMFFVILLIIIVLQFIFITFGGRALDCYSYGGLTIEHWGICVLFGIGGNIINIFIKMINEEKLCGCVKKNKNNNSNNTEHIQNKDRKGSVLGLKGNLRRMSSQLDKNQKRKFSASHQVEQKQTQNQNQQQQQQQQNQENQQQQPIQQQQAKMSKVNEQQQGMVE